MIDLYVLLSFMIAVATFLILPGPVNLVVINSSIRYGIKGAFWSIVGTNFASLVLIFVAGLMISGIAGSSEKLLTWLTVIGGIYLIYYAYGLFCAAKSFKSTPSEEQGLEVRGVGQIPVFDLVKKGFLVGISNPKDVFFFLSFFPPFISQLGLGFLSNILILTLVWCLLDYTLLLGYAIGARELITPKIEKAILFLCAVLFAALGVYAIFKNTTELF